MTAPLHYSRDYMALIAKQLRDNPRTEDQARKELGLPPKTMSHLRTHVDTRGPGFVVIEGDRK